MEFFLQRLRKKSFETEHRGMPGGFPKEVSVWGFVGVSKRIPARITESNYGRISGEIFEGIPDEIRGNISATFFNGIYVVILSRNSWNSLRKNAC